MILPEQYIGLAEREGIVAAIDNMLLIRCIQLVRKMQYRSEKLDFFCNISSHTLGDDAFFGDFVAFLESNRDLSKHLIFELSPNDYKASSGEHTSAFQSLICISYTYFCL